MDYIIYRIYDKEDKKKAVYASRHLEAVFVRLIKECDKHPGAHFRVEDSLEHETVYESGRVS